MFEFFIPIPKTKIHLASTHLNGSISGSSNKPLVARLHSDGPHPAEVTTDDLSQETYYLYK